MRVVEKYKGLFMLAAFFILLPAGVYLFALKGTVVNWREYRKDMKEVSALRNTNTSVVREESIVAYNEGTELIGSGLFIKLISGVADEHRILVERYTPVTTKNSQGIVLMTAEILLQGDYIALLKLIDYVEHEITSCKIISVGFKSVEERKSGRKKLTSTMLVQQIIQT